MINPKPNIILIMCDDLGYGDVGFNGNKIIQTPRLDAMRSEGARFTRFYAGGPVCSPTRGTCLTGCHYTALVEYLRDLKKTVSTEPHSTITHGSPSPA